MEPLLLTLALTAIFAVPAGWVAVVSGRRLFLAHGALALAYGFVCIYAMTAVASIFGIVIADAGSGLEPAGVLLSVGSVPLWLAIRAMADGRDAPAPRRGADPIFYSTRRCGQKALRP